MIGLALGAAAVFGVVAARRHRRHACAHGPGPGPYGWHGHHHHHHRGPWGEPDEERGPWGRGFRGGWGGRRAWMWAVLRRLDLSPAQDKIVRLEIEQLVEKIRGMRGEAKAARADLGRAVAGPTFDESVLGAMFERHDVGMVELRAAITGALRRIHEVLDARQRETLGEILGGGLFRGMGFGGPYRM